MAEQVVCVDIGSTFTKAVLVDLDAAEPVATASARTTVGTDVMEGVETVLAELGRSDSRASDYEVRACSSAGGGLRIAVVGNEELVTAEAGRRVALGSGGRVVHVGHSGLDGPAEDALVGAAPDVILLVGGTDGGNSEVLLHDAEVLAARGEGVPVVVAGNRSAADQVSALLTDGGVPHLLADNVVPRIGQLAPGPARAAIREIFLRHVIGGKGLSSRPEFLRLVRGATPDMALAGLEQVAAGGPSHPPAGDVVVVDVGGATTDVASVLDVDPERSTAGVSHDVVAATAVGRTVEADLGMRWSAPGVAEALAQEGTLSEDVRAAAERRHHDPGLLPATPTEAGLDRALASACVRLALQRHAGRARVQPGVVGHAAERSGRDLREVDLVVASGGVLRHAGDDAAALVGRACREGSDHWQVPRAPRVVLDSAHLLPMIGLLAADHPKVCSALCARLLADTGLP